MSRGTGAKSSAFDRRGLEILEIRNPKRKDDENGELRARNAILSKRIKELEKDLGYFKDPERNPCGYCRADHWTASCEVLKTVVPNGARTVWRELVEDFTCMACLRRGHKLAECNALWANTACTFCSNYGHHPVVCDRKPAPEKAAL